MKEELTDKSSRDDAHERNTKPNPNNETVFLGTTTLKCMVDAVYTEKHPLYYRNTFVECIRGASISVEVDASRWNETVYVYYWPDKHETIMTNIEGDFNGVAGSSAGFEGKVDLSLLAEYVPN